MTNQNRTEATNGVCQNGANEVSLRHAELQQEEKPIGLWGRMHLHYIKDYHEQFYNELRNNGRLRCHLLDVDTQAEKMYNDLIKQMAKRNNITEQLKADDMMKWVQLMNNIQSAAREIVLHECIYIFD